MPEYVYKAVTKQGQVVKNKVEDDNKNSLVRKLKHNELLPISIIQVGRRKKNKRNKKNKIDIDNIMKTANSANIFQGRADTKPKLKERLNMALSTEEKVTVRDVIIFTQNFYLLKKANFNNIHALSTIINSTENMTFRGVLEDILAGLEARRIYVYNYGILC